MVTEEKMNLIRDLFRKRQLKWALIAALNNRAKIRGKRIKGKSHCSNKKVVWLVSGFV